MPNVQRNGARRVCAFTISCSTNHARGVRRDSASSLWLIGWIGSQRWLWSDLKVKRSIVTTTFCRRVFVFYFSPRISPLNLVGK